MKVLRSWDDLVAKCRAQDEELKCRFHEGKSHYDIITEISFPEQLRTKDWDYGEETSETVNSNRLGTNRASPLGKTT